MEAAKKVKGYLQKFHIGHFTKGTRVRIDVSFEPAYDANVQYVTSNGPNSWVIATDVPCDTMPCGFKMLNIEHVKEVYAIAPGRVTFDPDQGYSDYHDSQYRERAQYANKPRNNYVASSVAGLVSMLLNSHPAFRGSDEHEWVIDGDVLAEEFGKRMPGRQAKHCDWLRLYNKRHAVKVMKQLLAHNKVSRRKAEREYNEYMSELFGEQTDDERERFNAALFAHCDEVEGPDETTELQALWGTV